MCSARPRATMRDVPLPHRDRDDDGAGLVEYALLLALIAIVSVGALTFTGSRTSAKLSVLGETLTRDDVAGTTTTTAGGATTTTAPSATTTTAPVVTTTTPVVTTTTAPVATTVPATTTTVCEFGTKGNGDCKTGPKGP
jgi:Flp pilus assembly pilin Flp